MQGWSLVVLGSVVAMACTGGQTGGEMGLVATAGQGGQDGRATGGSAGTAAGGSDTAGTGGLPDQGALECIESADCQSAAEERVARLDSPTTNPYTFDGAACVAVDDGDSVGLACNCSLGESAISVGPVGRDCYYYGRGGNCLIGDQDFAGCSPSDSAACVDVCARLEARLEEDAARTYDTELLYSECDEGTCRSVVRVDDHCFVDFGYESSPADAYDCSLGARAILDEHDRNQQDTEADEASLGFSAAEGTSGFINVTVGGDGLNVWAQFFDSPVGASAAFGTVFDPLEGIDDCGVFDPNGMGYGSGTDLIDIGELRFSYGGQDYDVPATSNSGDFFYAYGLELPGLAEAPAYGEEFGVRGGGGSFDAAFEVDGLRLPAALAISTLDQNAAFEPGALQLEWSGSGEAPIQLLMHVGRFPMEVAGGYEVNCVMADDGDFTIPAEIWAIVQNGFASAAFRRQNRAIVAAGDRTLAVNGIVDVSHEFLVGELCDQPDVGAACVRYAERHISTLIECGIDAEYLPTVESLCPEQETQACHVCAEYYDCAAALTECTEDGLMLYNGGCDCP